MLTQRQHDALFFIFKHIECNGYAPSIQEISDALYIKSKSNAHRLVTELVDRGYLKKNPKKRRALEVLCSSKAKIKFVPEKTIAQEEILLRLRSLGLNQEADIFEAQNERIQKLQIALDFYANPLGGGGVFGEKNIIPTNYFELGFGATAKAALEGMYP